MIEGERRDKVYIMAITERDRGCVSVCTEDKVRKRRDSGRQT